MSNSKEKILIVEDDKFLRELISRKLAGRGYEVETAVDGEDGFEKIKKTKPDVVLLDLILPGIDGFEVLSRVKKERRCKTSQLLFFLT